MHSFVVIDPSHSFVWVHYNFGHLVRSSDTIMAGGFDLEAFKAQLKEDLFVETRSMMREMIGEIAKLIREKQPVQSTDPVDLDGEIPIRERKENDVIVLVDPVG